MPDRHTVTAAEISTARGTSSDTCRPSDEVSTKAGYSRSRTPEPLRKAVGFLRAERLACDRDEGFVQDDEEAFHAS